MVYLVGAGIGSYKYISLYGAELIKKSDVIIYDRLIDNRLLDFAKKDCVKIFAGKEADNHSMKQSEINSLITAMAEKYDRVVRLKGGDPFVFGRGGEEAEECIKNNIPFEVVPGITSAIAAPELCGIPVTHRAVSQDLHIITGHTAEEENVNYDALAKMKGTLVFLMGVKNAGVISERLIKGGADKNTPAAFIEKGGTENERVFRTSLKNAEKCVKENGIKPPSVFVVGKTTEMKLKYNRKSVGMIGTCGFKERLKTGLFNYDIFDCGTLEVKKYDFDLDLSCEHIVFTSAAGADIFGEYLREKHIDIRKLAGIKFAVIGKSTYEALAKLGIYADVMPEKYTAEELSKALSGFKGKKLILRAEKGSDDLLKYIRNYEDVKIYDVEISNVREANTDYIIFGSPSAVDFYCGKYAPKGKIIAIGEVTAKRLG
ncbi:MAG: uroporphyrinogen-III C-methyltransferase [Clostridiales bacterium]|nr:uroporphyrinogen-III C-methyltransferase [Clostridiales bacterium]